MRNFVMLDVWEEENSTIMDEETKELMDEYDLDKDKAEELQDSINETGLDADDANEVWEPM